MTNYRTSFQMMGTIIELVVYHPNGEQLIRQAYQQLQNYAQRFTVNQPNSELMAVNHNAGIAPVTVEDDLFQLIKLAKARSQDLNNPFNIAIGPLVKAWRIGFNDAKVPSQNEIKAKLGLVDPTNILLDEANKSVYLSQVGMEIDLGAIAKGYFADQVKRTLVDAGVEHGFISLGGNVLTIGYSPKNSNHAWNVGIQNPLAARGDVLRAVPLKGMSMVTSGINERYFDVDGQRYHHLLDARTGMPITTEIASLTIISEQSVDGEIWSTAGFLPSVAEAMDYINVQAGIEAVAVSKEGEVSVTNGLVDQGGMIVPAEF
ncbi:thiamine biosynthesis protein ApbE [Vibrio ponticus]|uniref:FAD:protein FMN transferase n=1 Tax=Vibrio ponticus TaxID=265668 RepID=A0ABX3FPC4_9VIBR|nr:FAD:protein FMN transferase [Vibrio ponticus]OLQ94606.1 thiamine biosynthesis protein ApbE [Vibrio ponticus]